MIMLSAFKVGIALTLVQFAFGVAVMCVALLKAPGRLGGLAGTLKALSMLPVSGFIAISLFVRPLMSEAPADESWLRIFSVLLLDGILLYLGLALAFAAQRAAALGDST